MIGEEKPSLEELQHYGVKGMKWGVRRNRAQLSSSRSEKRAARKADNEKIKTARRGLKKDYLDPNSPTNKRYGEIEDSMPYGRALRKDPKAKKQFDDAVAELRKIDDMIANDPRRADAVRMTSGEKVAAIVLLGVGGQALISRSERKSQRLASRSGG